MIRCVEDQNSAPENPNFDSLGSPNLKQYSLSRPITGIVSGISPLGCSPRTFYHEPEAQIADFATSGKFGNKVIILRSDGWIQLHRFKFGGLFSKSSSKEETRFKIGLISTRLELANSVCCDQKSRYFCIFSEEGSQPMRLSRVFVLELLAGKFLLRSLLDLLKLNLGYIRSSLLSGMGYGGLKIIGISSKTGKGSDLVILDYDPICRKFKGEAETEALEGFSQCFKLVQTKKGGVYGADHQGRILRFKVKGSLGLHRKKKSMG